MTTFAGRLSEREIAYGVIVGLLVAGVIYLGKQAAELVKDKAGDVAEALNPMSPENIVYRSGNAVGGVLTGDPDYTIGSWWYDKWLDNPDKHIVDPTPHVIVKNGTLVYGNDRDLIH